MGTRYSVKEAFQALGTSAFEWEKDEETGDAVAVFRSAPLGGEYTLRVRRRYSVGRRAYFYVTYLEDEAGVCVELKGTYNTSLGARDEAEKMVLSQYPEAKSPGDLHSDLDNIPTA